MNEKFHVLIVEDDFRIAAIHRQFVEKVEGFVVQDCVKTAKEAFAHLQNKERQPDLIILDIYIPDVEGLELLWRLRTTYRAMDIVIVTAAKEEETVTKALRAGIFDYIVKPADASRFNQTLRRYKQQHEFLASKEAMEQADIDFITGVRDFSVSAEKSNHHLPKGIDPITLDEVTHLLADKKGDGITAVELSKQIGTSRSTARRYLEYLVSIKEIRTTLKYGTVGRPERQYIRN
ncbi:response regulator [Virgibacillus dakarensis]|uniref:Response regulator n=1 Tax=Lentibacillus populi TaxID=1827502 RepID=A0A9W5TZB1_9BACI|nr:response regulator [Lentibacillus populi]MTW85213.1 response regulator [Virgibacillus dakarensis]GGB48666.1 response regulator [Lentibacillus populi]